MKWYEYKTEEERIKYVYSKYSIKDFWDWWEDKNESRIMEIRIKNYEKIQEIAERFYLPRSSSGVYINSAIQLKNVLALTRDQTVWLGVNPRKPNYNKKGWKNFGSGARGGSSEENINEIAYLFLDIDRVKKLSPATQEELKNCDILCDKILERLASVNFSNSYIKLASGNGCQALIKLDFPIKLPVIQFNSEKKIFIPNNEFETIRKIMFGIGKQITTFSKKFKEELKCEVDNTCWRIAQVSALPFSKNFKYNSFKWRGIIEIKNEGINVGLTDYIMSKEEDIKSFKSKNIFSNKTSALLNKNRLKKGKLKSNKLIIFMLTNSFPAGYINNSLWAQLKILLRDSKIDLQSKEFIMLHKELCKKHNRSFSLNYPEKRFIFNEDVINAYAIEQCMIPPYEVWPGRTKKLNKKLENLSWDIKDFVKGEIELDTETTILEDLNNCRDSLDEGSYNNVLKVGSFIKGLITKYGEEKTKYYFKYLFERGLNWR